jgi:hypothetical protein
MTYTLATYTNVFAPWQEGDDEREKISEDSDTETFERLSEVAEWLRKHGYQSPSISPGPYSLHTWLSELDPYEHPYTGTLTETTVHTGDGFTDRTWSAVVRAVRWPGH